MVPAPANGKEEKNASRCNCAKIADFCGCATHGWHRELVQLIVAVVDQMLLLELREGNTSEMLTRKIERNFRLTSP